MLRTELFSPSNPFRAPLATTVGKALPSRILFPRTSVLHKDASTDFSVREDHPLRKALALVPLAISVPPHLKRWHARRVSFALVLQIPSLETAYQAHTTQSRPNPTAPSVKAVEFARDGLAFSLKSVRQASYALGRVCPRLFCSALQDTSAAKVLSLRIPQILSSSVPYRAHLARFVLAG